jgi:hypothetical protein
LATIGFGAQTEVGHHLLRALEPTVAERECAFGRADVHELVHVKGLHARRVVGRFAAETRTEHIEQPAALGQLALEHGVERVASRRQQHEVGRREAGRPVGAVVERAQQRNVITVVPSNPWIDPTRSGNERR